MCVCVYICVCITLVNPTVLYLNTLVFLPLYIYQGFFVATLYCLLNAEVRSELQKIWHHWQNSKTEKSLNFHSALSHSRTYFRYVLFLPSLHSLHSVFCFHSSLFFFPSLHSLLPVSPSPVFTLFFFFFFFFLAWFSLVIGLYLSEKMKEREREKEKGVLTF